MRVTRAGKSRESVFHSPTSTTLLPLEGGGGGTSSDGKAAAPSNRRHHHCSSPAIVTALRRQTLSTSTKCHPLLPQPMGDYGSQEIKRSRSAPAQQNIHTMCESDLTPILSSSVVRSENYLGTIVELGRTDTTIAEKLMNNGTTNDAALNEKKGVLGFIYTVVSTAFFFYTALVTFSVTYPGSPKALVSYNDTWIRGICITNVVSWFGGLAMLPFASLFKDCKSTDRRGFHIFLWAIYLWLLILIPEYFTTLRVFLRTSNWIIWPFGAIIFCLTVLLIFYIEGQQPTVLSKWAEYMWGKIGLLSDTINPFWATGQTIQGVNSDAMESV